MSEHVEPTTLLAYVEGDAAIDRPFITRHVAACDDCRRALERLEQLMFVLADVEAFARIARNGARRELESIAQDVETRERQWSDAAAFMATLDRLPIRAWRRAFDAMSGARTRAVIELLVARIDEVMNRAPEIALELIAVAADVADLLPNDDEKRLSLGDVWKHRSNAFRHLGRYDDALHASEKAQAYYDTVRVGEFDAAQAQYTRAAAFFKMTRLADARTALAPAMSTLKRYGETLPLAKALMLDAAIRHEEGDIDGAFEAWVAVAPVLERFGEERELARILTNLAEYYLARGNYDGALASAGAAIGAFSNLRMDVERTRAEWTHAMIRVAQRDADAGAALESVARSFDRFHMESDSAFVRLDLVEELLRNEEWEKAEAVARQIEPLLRRAGVTLAKIRAATYLREAVLRRDATLELVKQIRAYMQHDDGSADFASRDVNER